MPFVCSADALKMLQAHRQAESDLIERDGVFYLGATCDVPEAEQYKPDGFIGVDLGIENVATASTGYLAAERGLNRTAQTTACPARQAPQEAHQERQAAAQGTCPQGSAARREYQPHHLQDDRDRGSPTPALQGRVKLTRRRSTVDSSSAHRAGTPSAAPWGTGHFAAWLHHRPEERCTPMPI